MFPPLPQAFVETTWRGQKQRLALALQENFLYFWEIDSPRFRSVPEEWVFAVDHPLGMNGESQLTPKCLVDELERALANNQIGRRFQLCDTLTVFFHEDHSKSSVVFQWGEAKKEAEFYSWYSIADDLSLSSCIERLELEVINGPFGYGYFADALADNDIPYMAGKPTKICLSTGTDTQWKRIADLIFQLAPEWIEGVLSRAKCEAAGITVVIPLYRPAYHLGVGHDKNWGLFSVPHPRAELWEIWVKHFAPYPDRNLHGTEIEAGRRLFSFNIYPQAYHDNFDYMNNRPCEVTQHEQLEFFLELRNWLRDDVGLADERIAELLS